MEQEDIDSELFELAREWMSVSKLQVRNLPGHVAKETDVALWKPKLPVDSVQFDQIMGWGNFTRAILGIDPNTCKNYLLGDVHILHTLRRAYGWLTICFCVQV